MTARACGVTVARMTPPDKAAQREARQSARLKANLARRKDQARRRESTEDAGAAPPEPSPACVPVTDKGEQNPSS